MIRGMVHPGLLPRKDLREPQGALQIPPLRSPGFLRGYFALSAAPRDAGFAASVPRVWFAAPGAAVTPDVPRVPEGPGAAEQDVAPAEQDAPPAGPDVAPAEPDAAPAGRVAPEEWGAALDGLVLGAPRGPAVLAGQELDVPAPTGPGAGAGLALAAAGRPAWRVMPSREPISAQE